VFVRKQPQAARLGDHAGEKLARHAILQQPRPVARKGRVVEARLGRIHIEQPAEQQVVTRHAGAPGYRRKKIASFAGKQRHGPATAPLRDRAPRAGAELTDFRNQAAVSFCGRGLAWIQPSLSVVVIARYTLASTSLAQPALRDFVIETIKAEHRGVDSVTTS
jgi:hypothetical protein